ncbi:hypothetical protein C1645_826238 [Glomus cerebriforme]|uniref:Uncharacterized protein n=1 Tax=Glomus cerebriforme TaxID=658196 RepID=A0A397SUB4_9GLOM|nr:hypothetical protein C1645_826238 [Glomus cerebriforme]
MNSSLPLLIDFLIPDTKSKDLHEEISKELNVTYLSESAQELDEAKGKIFGIARRLFCQGGIRLYNNEDFSNPFIARLNKRWMLVRKSPNNVSFEDINVLGTDYLHNHNAQLFVDYVNQYFTIKFDEQDHQDFREVTTNSNFTKKGLKKLLTKYGVDGEGIKTFPFKPETEKINDDDEDFQYCIAEIKYKMGIIGSAKFSNEAVRCLYIEAILSSAICIVRRIVKKRIFLEPQFEDIGKVVAGQVDYAIEKIIDSLNKELICIIINKNQNVLGIMQSVMQLESSYHTNKKKQKESEAFNDDFDYLYGIVTTAMDWYFIMYTPERIYCITAGYHITLTEEILEDEERLRRGVKKVMEVIVGLLKDRIEVNASPDSRRARMKKYIKK